MIGPHCEEHPLGTYHAKSNQFLLNKQSALIMFFNWVGVRPRLTFIHTYFSVISNNTTYTLLFMSPVKRLGIMSKFYEYSSFNLIDMGNMICYRYFKMHLFNSISLRTDIAFSCASILQKMGLVFSRESVFPQTGFAESLLPYRNVFLLMRQQLNPIFLEPTSPD